MNFLSETFKNGVVVVNTTPHSITGYWWHLKTGATVRRSGQREGRRNAGK